MHVLSGGSSHTFIGSNYSESIWTNDQLNMALTQSPYNESFINFRSTWHEQREFGIEYAMNALSETTDAAEMRLYEAIKNEMNYLQSPQMPNVSDKNEWNMINNLSQIFDVKINNNAYRVQFDATTGALKMLKNALSEVDFVNTTKNNGFGKFIYQTYTESNFSNFWSKYSVQDPTGCNLEYCKIGMSKAAPFTNTSHYAATSLVGLYQNANDPNVFLAESNLGKVQNLLFRNLVLPSESM